MIISLDNLDVLQQYYFLIGLGIGIFRLKGFLSYLRSTYGAKVDTYPTKLFITLIHMGLWTVGWIIIFAIVGTQWLGNKLGDVWYHHRLKKGVIKK